MDDQFRGHLVTLSVRVVKDPNELGPVGAPIGTIITGEGGVTNVAVAGSPVGDEWLWRGDAPTGFAATVGMHTQGVLFRMANARVYVLVDARDPVDQNDLVRIAWLVEQRLDGVLSPGCTGSGAGSARRLGAIPRGFVAKCLQDDCWVVEPDRSWHWPVYNPDS